MKRAKRYTFKPTTEQQLTLNGLTYAARKLWNVANYERKQWNKESGTPYPNWFYQKKRLKTHFWYKSLPSQSAQTLLHELEGAWKSFYRLKQTGGVENPKPPRYKHTSFHVKYLKDGFQMLDIRRIRLSLRSS
jgi:putative transposase